ncbi:hypothetical protein SEVIR_3G124700v4 [Setaria viridis]|uniref:cysteine dioxygenase n=2 Tax=Setaria TaxID=4554 RepID=K3Z8S7_SETIT|nr:plant cysteine oxidase 2 [Setaria italica]XP_034588365.1 plant cysteine oxidase 2-like [Setaria viridis]RCV16241.1 hypothetical protein SETIT_3G122400v2 [Setaria italica]TKW25520.1 hypothetical protein SEVIR_3G124700v2 [Setaria viridis]TKW25521.1 hypothetical protein SEVIR_3G124700v2 [Setaria viridis]
MPVQVGGSKVAEPRARVELSPTAVADKGRASSKKFRRRQKKATSSLSPMQRLFDTSKEVFAGSSPGFVPPPDAVARLSGLLNDLKPQDVGVDSNMTYFKHADSRGPPRVSYLHFYDCPKFSFGIFCLPKSAVIPLHNHPGMTVFSKILFGSMHLKSYDWAKSSPDSNDNALENSDGARLAKVNTDAVFDASAETVVLYPENGGNLHCFTALTPCAVLDVLGPPYDRDDGRDCSYYDESPFLSSCGGDEQYSWLKEVPTNFEMKGTQMPRKFSI